MTALIITITQIIIHTPTWVWAVLALLVWRGLKSTQPRDVGPGKLVLLPLVLVGLSAYGILSGAVSSATLAGMALGALAGVAAGLTLERRRPGMALPNGKIRLAGEWTPMVVILAVFLTHYAAAVTPIMAPALAVSAPFLIVMGAISALSSAMLVTRTVLRLRLLFATPALPA